jgi:hypothetical protein
MCWKSNAALLRWCVAFLIAAVAAPAQTSAQVYIVCPEGTAYIDGYGCQPLPYFYATPPLYAYPGYAFYPGLGVYGGRGFAPVFPRGVVVNRGFR